GRHYFEALPIGGQVTLRHVLEARCGLRAWLHWIAVIEPLHNALLEDALDRAERALNPSSSASTPWSLWVRLLRFVIRAR
ncbi:MAG: SRPBCC family protein, partial [Thermodesulfobacteriota bacterium]